MGTDRNSDGVEIVGATEADLATYEAARRQLAQMKVPLLHETADANSRLFVMAFDGTGNDMDQQHRSNWTNVALLREQVNALNSPTISAGYVPGPGTQSDWVARIKDQITGSSFESRIEEGYDKLIRQAKVWLAENPGADIKVLAAGFSRGAEQGAAFTRIVEERGIQDPDGARYQRNEAGLITGVSYTRPPLVAPGQVAQAALLYDPVGTGEPDKHDRRLPPSVISALQITALNERRDQFPSTEHVQPGVSADGRSANVATAGCHSNIGGGYFRNGLSDRNFNLAADYLNALSDTPFVQKRELSRDPDLDVIHRSEQHEMVYTTDGFDDGVRDRTLRLAPDAACRPRGPCYDREPVDAELAARFEWRASVVTVDPLAPLPEPSRPFWEKAKDTPTPQQEVDELFRRLTDGALLGDYRAMDKATDAFTESDAGRQWLQAGRTQLATQDQTQAQAQQQARQEPELAPPEPAGPVMRR